MSQVASRVFGIVVLAVLVNQPFNGSVRAADSEDRMTYAQAKARIPQRQLPEFWVGDVKGLADRFERLTRGTARVIAVSPGGRPIHLVTYGAKEPLQQKANFNSAIGGRLPSAYTDRNARKKPVVFFVGPVHGHEVEALTGLVNLIEIMETGKDLRGRGQRPLQELGSQCRLLIVPTGNPDGTARFEPRSLQGMGQNDLRFWGQGTWSDDRLCGWPQVKRQHPLVGDNVGFVGCYFNDAGINPMHDEFFAPMGPEAPAILKIAREEGPDLAVSLHSHEPPPALLRPAYLPNAIQQDVRTLAQRCFALLEQRNLPHNGLPEVRAEDEQMPSAFNLTSALYHICGATSFTFECPHGLKGSCEVTHEQILDIQLTLYEAMLQHAFDAKK
ncbi:MAG TPA: M14 family zinc carboxypeptidase [Sedimentisphaerales bacterium]|nr:M14 family zinc carboxypeptidase [Sedimentisphaerales bacterium]HRS11092.1 M14 family zinc carboxypeptidase [Sedimentisphaerales bacterium]HRV47699.1 M14 family zinc carboxypeptidase [Sedimentisphaerales bacterium]